LDNARRLANSGNVVALVNLEMKNTQTMDRLLAMNTQIEATRLVKYYSDVSPQEEDKIMREMGRMSKELSFFAIDTPSVSLSDMMSHIKRLQDRIGKEYVVLYIDLFTKLTDFGEAESALDYEKICNKFQKEVKDAGIHAIPIVQINREADKEKITAVEEVSKLYPKVNQIKNAGAFEEIADNVFLVCNPSGYLKKYEWGQYVPSYFRLDVAKQRGGSTSSDDSVILYKNDNTYLSLVTPEDGWNPLTISIDDSKISGYL
jgi:replicative DNA helicase